VSTTKRAQGIKKNGPIDQNMKTNKKIVKRVNVIKLIVNIKKRRMGMRHGNDLEKKERKKKIKKQTTKIS
jgi:hypothetical protein